VSLREAIPTPKIGLLRARTHATEVGAGPHICQTLYGKYPVKAARLSQVSTGTCGRTLDAEPYVSSDGQPRRHRWWSVVTTSAVVEFDGGARPNPGQGAIGHIVESDDWIERGSASLNGGERTDTRAEYHALARGLEVAREKGCTAVKAEGDSESIIKQMRGVYGVNDPSLSPLHDRTEELADGFENFGIRPVPREKNREADRSVERAPSD
jgi:ribonuclease HI